MLARLAALAVVALGLGMAPAAQAASMWNGWEEISGSPEQCQETAASTLRTLGFTVTVNRPSVLGWRGQDGVTVRCIADRRLAVVFVYTATTSEDGRALLEQIRTALKPGAAAPTPAPAPARPGNKF